MRAKLFINRRIINDYNSITYVGAPTYLTKLGAVIDRFGIFDYNDPQSLPISEDYIQNPVNPYGQSKLARELF